MFEVASLALWLFFSLWHQQICCFWFLPVSHQWIIASFFDSQKPAMGAEISLFFIFFGRSTDPTPGTKHHRYVQWHRHVAYATDVDSA